MLNQLKTTYSNHNDIPFSLRKKKSYSLIGKGKTVDVHNEKVFSKIQKSYLDSLEEMKHLKETQIIKVDLDQMPIQKIYNELEINTNSPSSKANKQESEDSENKQNNPKKQINIPELLQRTLPIRSRRSKTNANSPTNNIVTNFDLPQQFQQMYHNFNNYQMKQQLQNKKKQKNQIQNDKISQDYQQNVKILQQKQEQILSLREEILQSYNRDEINSRQTITPILPTRVFITEKGKLINDRFDSPTKQPLSYAESIKKQIEELNQMNFFQTGKDKIAEHLDYKDMTDNNITNFNNDNKQYIQNLVEKHSKHIKPQGCSKGEQVRADSALKNYRNQLNDELEKFHNNIEQKSITTSSKYQKPIKRLIPYKDGLKDDYFFKEEHRANTEGNDDFLSRNNTKHDQGMEQFKKFIQDTDFQKIKEIPQWVKINAEKDKTEILPKIHSPSRVSQYIQSGVLPRKSVLENQEQMIHLRKKKYIRKIEKIVTECDDYKLYIS